mmetsp:Transcript_98896/g.276313  ORF Transcript_98896/g.276313 Transcript_98896/m.276313 type:complete len:226 (+) Transcript_98896:275-952(+)
MGRRAARAGVRRVAAGLREGSAEPVDGALVADEPWLGRGVRREGEQVSAPRVRPGQLQEQAAQQGGDGLRGLRVRPPPRWQRELAARRHHVCRGPRHLLPQHVGALCWPRPARAALPGDGGGRGGQAAAPRGVQPAAPGHRPGAWRHRGHRWFCHGDGRLHRVLLHRDGHRGVRDDGEGAGGEAAADDLRREPAGLLGLEPWLRLRVRPLRLRRHDARDGHIRSP